MPPARNDPLEERVFRGFRIQVKHLRIVVAGELHDLVLVERVRSAHEALTDGEVLEIQRHWRRRHGLRMT